MSKEALLKKIVIYCPDLNEEVTLELDFVYLRGWEYSNDYMFDNGVDITIDKCKCGKSHTIEL